MFACLPLEQVNHSNSAISKGGDSGTAYNLFKKNTISQWQEQCGNNCSKHNSATSTVGNFLLHPPFALKATSKGEDNVPHQVNIFKGIGPYSYGLLTYYSR